ncbi:hypothetical protein P3875_05045 [Myroides sp. JBRI-B21084]|uniref:hypothetical protein n=1 Tax=Myroides sp. JBRI-B21084 TaxID=3119977 RepID=UPI0026E1F923|nr:hypothetical protein [Paenimyroides cloacae]WKW47430.1 hypothetical protein P3875_05045 [Paenimyroides cloacae]
MKKLVKGIFVAASLIAFNSLHAQVVQSGSFVEKLSVEAQYGLNNVLSPTEGINAGDFSGFNFAQLGVNYHFNDVWALRGTVANSKFTHKDIDGVGVTYTKIVLEGSYNILAAANGSAQAFEVNAHAGLGLGLGKSEFTTQKEEVGVAQIGIKPTFNFNESIGVFVDGTFVQQFSQHFNFAGTTMKVGPGSYLNVGLGLHYRFN